MLGVPHTHCREAIVGEGPMKVVAVAHNVHHDKGEESSKSSKRRSKHCCTKNSERRGASDRKGRKVKKGRKRMKRRRKQTVHLRGMEKTRVLW